jgi:hypothetical protein
VRFPHPRSRGGDVNSLPRGTGEGQGEGATSRYTQIDSSTASSRSCTSWFLNRPPETYAAARANASELHGTLPAFRACHRQPRRRAWFGVLGNIVKLISKVPRCLSRPLPDPPPLRRGGDQSSFRPPIQKRGGSLAPEKMHSLIRGREMEPRITSSLLLGSEDDRGRGLPSSE